MREYVSLLLKLSSYWRESEPLKHPYLCFCNFYTLFYPLSGFRAALPMHYLENLPE